MILAGTGHRPTKLGNEWDGVGHCSDWCRHCIQKAFERVKPEEVISGMALGFDTLFAEEALRAGIPLTAAVPFTGQENKWPETSQQRYRAICSQAEVVVVCSGGYSPDKMQVRNQWMVDRCSILLACWDGSRGGTCNCVEYALKQGFEVRREIEHGTILKFDPRTTISYR